MEAARPVVPHQLLPTTEHRLALHVRSALCENGQRAALPGSLTPRAEALTDQSGLIVLSDLSAQRVTGMGEVGMMTEGDHSAALHAQLVMARCSEEQLREEDDVAGLLPPICNERWSTVRLLHASMVSLRCLARSRRCEARSRARSSFAVLRHPHTTVAMVRFSTPRLLCSTFHRSHQRRSSISLTRCAWEVVVLHSPQTTFTSLR